MHPGRCADEVEDAIQTACKRFLDRAEGISTPGEVYAWLRTTAHRQLNRRDERSEREITVDPTLEGSLGEAVAADPTPEEEVIADEDEADLVDLERRVIVPLVRVAAAGIDQVATPEQQLLEALEAPVGDQDRPFAHGARVLPAQLDISPEWRYVESLDLEEYLESADIGATMPQGPGGGR